MPRHLRLIARKPSLEGINRQIATIAATKQGSEIRAFFNSAARLARVAAEASKNIECVPGVDIDEFREALSLWYRVSDYADVIALLCRGGSQTLAEALITLRFLESLVPDARRQ